MKKVSALLLFVFWFQILKAQVNDKGLNLIDVLGSSKVVILPDFYKAQIVIEEEEQKAGYQTIGKSIIDSIKITLYKNLKKYNIEAKDLKLIAVSSRALGQYPNVLINNAYECVLKSKEQGEKLVNEMRFAGLKGIIIKAQYINSVKRVQDFLYTNALTNANFVANLLAKKISRTVGDAKNIQVLNRQFPGDTDNYGDIYNVYNSSKFEMDYKDKYATCNVRVEYELK